MLDRRSQLGFSLIELMLVCAIAGILAVVAIPNAIKARDAAQRSSMMATLRTIHTNQMTYMSTNGRYARATELNTYFRGTLGRNVSGVYFISKDTLYLNYPSFSPSDTSLRTQYGIAGYRLNTTYGYWQAQYAVQEDGMIDGLAP